MQNINIHIQVNNNKITLTFSPSSKKKTIVNFTAKQLYSYYKLKVEDLSPNICRQIIKDNKFKTEIILSFDSTIKILYNKTKDFKFQVEDDLVYITHIPDNDSFLTPISNIKDFNSFNYQTFEELKQIRKKITPLNTNIETTETQPTQFFPLD